MKVSDARKMIEDARRKMAEADGAIKQLTKQLKEEFGVTSLKEARAKLLSIQEEMSTTTAQIEEGMKEVEGILRGGDEEGDEE